MIVIRRFGNVNNMDDLINCIRAVCDNMYVNVIDIKDGVGWNNRKEIVIVATGEKKNKYELVVL